VLKWASHVDHTRDPVVLTWTTLNNTIGTRTVVHELFNNVLSFLDNGLT